MTTALVAGAVVTFVAAYAGLLVAGYKPVAVYSGSMRPTLGVGSLAVDSVVAANAARDPWAIRLDGNVGRVAFQVPVAGYVLWYAHTREVRGALLTLFVGFMLVGVLRRIWGSGARRPLEAEA